MVYFRPCDEAMAQKKYCALYYAGAPVGRSISMNDVAVAVGFAIIGAWEEYCRSRPDETGLSRSNMRAILVSTAPVELQKVLVRKRVQGVDLLAAAKMAERQALALADARYGADKGAYAYAKAAGGPARVYNFQDMAPWCPAEPLELEGGVATPPSTSPVLDFSKAQSKV